MVELLFLLLLTCFLGVSWRRRRRIRNSGSIGCGRRDGGGLAHEATLRRTTPNVDFALCQMTEEEAMERAKTFAKRIEEWKVRAA